MKEKINFQSVIIAAINVLFLLLSLIFFITTISEINKENIDSAINCTIIFIILSTATIILTKHNNLLKQ